MPSSPVRLESKKDTVLSVATIDRSTSGDGTAVIPAPGAYKRVWVRDVHIQRDATTGDVTVIVKSGSTAMHTIPINDNVDGLSRMVDWPMGQNEAVYLNLSANVAIKGWLSYQVVEY